jgi:hypothetical protein
MKQKRDLRTHGWHWHFAAQTEGTAVANKPKSASSRRLAWNGDAVFIGVML